ncbi:MAG TPA: multicopper oxidase domain-containing protein, partial [Candidatus Brocadiales bacterium]|nr:multicopper oxidase domain-containing protein [Candidatus Brocadiales bacterium]
MTSKKKNIKMLLVLTLVVGIISIGLTPDFTLAATTCYRTITADVVALDQAFFWNRYGALQPQGMIFALRRDVINSTTLLALTGGGAAEPGNVQLRPEKRPRPMVLRMNVGDCLTISFQNLLASTPVDDEQPATRTASIHVIGMQLVDSIASDGSNVGTNASSLVAPGGSKTYKLYAEREGAHLLYSAAATTGGEGDGGSLNAGLFGAVNVQP